MNIEMIKKIAEKYAPTMQLLDSLALDKVAYPSAGMVQNATVELKEAVANLFLEEVRTILKHP